MPPSGRDEDVGSVAIDPGFKQPQQLGQRRLRVATRGLPLDLQANSAKGDLPVRPPSSRSRDRHGTMPHRYNCAPTRPQSHSTVTSARTAIWTAATTGPLMLGDLVTVAQDCQSLYVIERLARRLGGRNKIKSALFRRWGAWGSNPEPTD